MELLNKYQFSLETENIISSNNVRYNYIFIRQNNVDYAVQRAIRDFPQELLRQYSGSLKILFYIFCHNLLSQRISDRCKQFVKGWGKADTIKTYENIIYFNSGVDEKTEKDIIEEIHELYGLKDFISCGRGYLKFTFDLDNIDILMRGIPCNIKVAHNAYEFVTGKTPLFPPKETSVGAVKKDGQSSSSLQVPKQTTSGLSFPRDSASLRRDGSTKSNKSDDLALEASYVSPNTSFGSPCESGSFNDSGHDSKLSSPTHSAHSDVSGITVVSKSKSKSVSNSPVTSRPSFSRVGSTPPRDKPKDFLDNATVKKRVSEGNIIMV